MKDSTLPINEAKKKQFIGSRKHQEIYLKKWLGWAGGYSNLEKENS